jgi:hypothetical protein
MPDFIISKFFTIDLARQEQFLTRIWIRIRIKGTARLAKKYPEYKSLDFFLGLCGNQTQPRGSGLLLLHRVERQKAGGVLPVHDTHQVSAQQEAHQPRREQQHLQLQVHLQRRRRPSLQGRHSFVNCR